VIQPFWPEGRSTYGARLVVVLFAPAGLPLPSVTKVVMSWIGSAPMTWEIATNSTTSTRRSPPSYLATKDWGFFDTQLVPIIRRQIRNAERIIELTRHGRIKLRRYEQNIEIDG
jgi:hypothetical protein